MTCRERCAQALSRGAAALVVAIERGQVSLNG
jgi:hypothetical protein